MIKIEQVEQWAKRLESLVPEQLKEADVSLKEQFRKTLMGFAHELELATREEFDVQTKVLLKTRQKLEALEQRLQALEEKV